VIDYLAAIRSESAAFYDSAADADPSARVPSCPDWSIAELVWHLAEVHWFWATVAERTIIDPNDLGQLVRTDPPTDYPALLAYGREQADRLLDVLQRADPSTTVWTWAAQTDVGFIVRHQVQEAAVHRWDLQSATSTTPAPIATDIAVDSVDEFLTLSFPAWHQEKPPLPGSLHVHCTDADGEWLMQPDRTMERTHAKADVALRGTANDLLLALYQRLPLDVLEVVGDRSVAEAVIAYPAD
jgi:uncharacterized protein (TIGR03083 family)